MIRAMMDALEERAEIFACLAIALVAMLAAFRNLAALS